MSDLPGPEKPPPVPLGEEDHSGRPIDANELLAQFRALMASGEIKRGAAGPYNGRSGHYLKGRVRERHKIAVVLQACGFKNNEIASALGYTPSRVSIILNSKKPELQQVRKDAVERVVNNSVDLTGKIRHAAIHALDTMISLVDSAEEDIQFKSAKDILDRAGYSPVKKQANFNADVPHEELAGILSRIDDANKVVARRGDWEVREFPQDGAA